MPTKDNHNEQNLKKVMFVCLFELTDTFIQISSGLKKSVHAYYLASTHDAYNKLRKNGICDDDIINVSSSRKNVRKMAPPDERDKQSIAEYEKSGITFPSIIMMSRFYDGEKYECLLKYMVNIARNIEQFISIKGIELVIAEPTNAVELLVYQVCAKVGVKAFSISMPRLPYERIMLFGDIKESEIVRLNTRENNTFDESEIIKWLKTYRANPGRPAYFKSQATSRSYLNLIRSFLYRFMIVYKDLAGYNEINSNTFIEQLRLYGRKYYSYGVKRYADLDPDQLNERNYAVYFLQVQPERSVDVMSPFYSNQYEIIRCIRRAMPAKLELLVKDHPSVYGIQENEFYKKMFDIPGVKLIRGEIDSRTLIKGAQFVSTITGTTGYEAALLGIPSIIFSDVFFGELEQVHICKSYDTLPKIIKSIIMQHSTIEKNDESVIRFLRMIWLNSVPSKWDGGGGILKEEVIGSMCRLLRLAIKN